jgi:ketosteroid isomerase-like protein
MVYHPSKRPLARRRAVMQDSSEIRAEVLRYYDTMRAGDMAALNELVAVDGMIGVGTNSAEYWPDRYAFLGSMENMVTMMGGSFDLTPQNILAYQDGDFGWALDLPTVRTPDGSGFPVRLTMAFQRDNGRWRLIMLHASTASESVQAEE